MAGFSVDHPGVESYLPLDIPLAFDNTDQGLDCHGTHFSIRLNGMRHGAIE
jgi:hypothetical protein